MVEGYNPNFEVLKNGLIGFHHMIQSHSKLAFFGDYEDLKEHHGFGVLEFDLSPKSRVKSSCSMGG